MFNNIYKINKDDFIFFLILFLFWASINTGSKYINIDISNKIYFNFSINFLRAVQPYIIFIFFIIKYQNYLKNIILKYDLIFFCLFLYGIFQILGLFFSFVSLNEHYWAICLFAILIFFKIILEQKDLNFVNLIFVINIIIILSIFLIFIFIAFKNNILSTNLFYHSKSFFTQFGGEPLPRSSGISRMALILFFILNSLYFVYKNKYKNITNLIILTLLSFLIFLIFILQSRGVILFFIISYLTINIFFTFNNLKERIIFYIFTILVPLVFFFSYPISKNYLNQTLNSDSVNETKFMRKDFIFENEKNLNFSNKIKSFSNNRVDAWDYLLQFYLSGEINNNMKNKVINKKFKPKEIYLDKKIRFLFGLGPQADRHLMQLKKTAPGLSHDVLGPFGAHASNVFIYSLICGGFLSLLSFLIINLCIFLKIFRIIKLHKQINLQSNWILISSIFIILFLLFRGLIENSYGVFGVDLILLMSTYVVLEKNLKKINE